MNVKFLGLQAPSQPITLHLTTDGKNRLCGADSPWAAHVHYANWTHDPKSGDTWCQECQAKLKEINQESSNE